MFVRQVVDPTKDREVRVHFILRCNVHKAVIFDIEVRPAEIQFFSRVYEPCCMGVGCVVSEDSFSLIGGISSAVHLSTDSNSFVKRSA